MQQKTLEKVKYNYIFNNYINLTDMAERTPRMNRKSAKKDYNRRIENLKAIASETSDPIERDKCLFAVDELRGYVQDIGIDLEGDK